jgi:allantoin racemase
MTAAIARQARDAAGPGTQITAATPSFGPASVEGPFESCLSAVGVLDCAYRLTPGHDAVILAGFGDLGRDALQEIVAVPVLDITDAAAAVATLLGRGYAVVTTLPQAVPAIKDRLRLAGLAERCVSVRASGVPVLDLEASHAAVQRIVAQARCAVEQDGADVIVLGCAGMAALAATVAEAVGVPVVDGVSAAVTLAEGFGRLGLAPRHGGTYRFDQVKTLTGWPLTGWPLGVSS